MGPIPPTFRVPFWPSLALSGLSLGPFCGLSLGLLWRFSAHDTDDQLDDDGGSFAFLQRFLTMNRSRTTTIILRYLEMTEHHMCGFLAGTNGHALMSIVRRFCRIRIKARAEWDARSGEGCSHEH